VSLWDTYNNVGRCAVTPEGEFEINYDDENSIPQDFYEGDQDNIVIDSYYSSKFIRKKGK
jgi:hypothetical protein